MHAHYNMLYKHLKYENFVSFVVLEDIQNPVAQQIFVLVNNKDTSTKTANFKLLSKIVILLIN